MHLVREVIRIAGAEDMCTRESEDKDKGEFASDLVAVQRASDFTGKKLGSP